MLKSSTYIKNKINISPDIAIVLGSGLSDLEEILNNKIEIQYKNIPEYNDTTVEGHKGKFICGDLYGKSILLAMGRFHCYEGLSIQEVGMPIEVFYQLGCELVILTNSSGCLVQEWEIGDIMIVNGHYDFTFRDSINNPSLNKGSSFYNKALIELALTNKNDINLRVGNYAWLLGPMYETKAEVENIKNHGAHAVGMSTIPEVITAEKLGIKVLVLALLSNYAVGLSKDKVSHDKVLYHSTKFCENMKLLLIQIIKEI